MSAVTRNMTKGIMLFLLDVGFGSSAAGSKLRPSIWLALADLSNIIAAEMVDSLIAL